MTSPETGLCDVLYLFGVGGGAVEEYIIPNQDMELLSTHKKLGQISLQSRDWTL